MTEWKRNVLRAGLGILLVVGAAAGWTVRCYDARAGGRTPPLLESLTPAPTLDPFVRLLDYPEAYPGDVQFVAGEGQWLVLVLTPGREAVRLPDVGWIAAAAVDADGVLELYKDGDFLVTLASPLEE
jgi:hypothetical protein